MSRISVNSSLTRFVSCDPQERTIPSVVELVGADCVVFATDYPHDDPGGKMKFEDVRLLRDHKQITEDAKELIRHKNAEQLFCLAS